MASLSSSSSSSKNVSELFGPNNPFFGPDVTMNMVQKWNVESDAAMDDFFRDYSSFWKTSETDNSNNVSQVKIAQEVGQKLRKSARLAGEAVADSIVSVMESENVRITNSLISMDSAEDTAHVDIIAASYTVKSWLDYHSKKGKKMFSASYYSELKTIGRNIIQENKNVFTLVERNEYEAVKSFIYNQLGVVSLKCAIKVGMSEQDKIDEMTQIKIHINKRKREAAKRADEVKPQKNKKKQKNQEEKDFIDDDDDDDDDEEEDDDNDDNDDDEEDDEEDAAEEDDMDEDAKSDSNISDINSSSGLSDVIECLTVTSSGAATVATLTVNAEEYQTLVVRNNIFTSFMKTLPKTHKQRFMKDLTDPHHQNAFSKNEFS